MPNGFDIMNLLGQKAEEPSEAPAPSPEKAPEDTCQMCGAMAQHADPEKLKAFMANNPFAKK